MKIKLHLGIILLSVSLLTAAQCGKKTQILVDGSSTVYPVTEAVAEEFRNVDSSVNVTVGISGTGGGFKKFCHNETDISDASRPIKSGEQEKCSANGVEYLEIPVAYDGLAVLTHKSNDWAQELTVAQLKQIFQAESPAQTWKELNAAWPDEKIRIYAPGQDSGTFDYFSETILGKESKMRNDATFSEDDNMLVTGIAGDKFAIGFFGLAYYEENKEKLSLVKVVNPASGQAVEPNLETVKSGQYAPLSRPIFIYISKKAAQRAEVRSFVDFYLEKVGVLVKDVGYIPLDQNIYTKNAAEFKKFN
ncbi:MAG: PstS family phosphate ABC transporter substrate-binding protein [Leptospiraceae bacterium]|nr:PstS family phosphate ABC transporter substrate-binding protein [Leptospiraceae bacterium]